MRTTQLFMLLVILATLVACGGDSRPACADGEAGCACRVDDTCADGLACDLATRQCETTREVALPAIDPAARACEILLADDGARVVTARFDGSVTGESIRQAPRTALAFHANEDRAIASSAVRAVLAGAGGMTVARTRCFDRDGRALAGR